MWLQQAEHGSPNVPLPSNAFQLFLGDPEVFRSDKICDPSSRLCVHFRVFYQLKCPPKEGDQKASRSDAQTTTARPFDPLSKGEPNSLRPIVCRSFSPDPKRATTCEGCSVD